MSTTIDYSALRLQHLDWLRAHNYSSRTIEDRAHWLRHFTDWLTCRGIASLEGFTRSVLEDYSQHWADHRKADGRPLSGHTQRIRLVPPKSFGRWLAKQGLLQHDPTAGLESPRLMQSLPKNIMTHAETERVMRIPRIGRRNGLRDRALLEVFYSSGIRRAELAQLRLESVDPERGLLMVCRGKGGKDRFIPIGARALHWIRRYLKEWRPQHAKPEADPKTIFITERGHSLSLKQLSSIVCQCIRRAKIGKTGSCHLFRHTMATLMLENGADIRYLQEQLGHASLQTTQLYTHVSVRHLKATHARTHPAEIGYKPGKIGIGCRSPRAAITGKP